MRARLEAPRATSEHFDAREVPASSDHTDRQHREVRSLLERDFPQEPSDAIRGLVEEAWDRTAGSKVQQFRAILAERYCRDVLRRRSTRRSA